MAKYLLSKIAQSIITVLLVSVIIFWIIEILPGDVGTATISDELDDEQVYKIYVRTDFSPVKGRKLSFVREAWSSVVRVRR